MADNTTLNAGSGGDVIAADDIGGVKYQRVKATFGSDGTATDVDDTHGLPVSINAAGFIFSTNNSTTSQLAAGATFTGTIESVLNQPSLSLLLTSDQPVTITVYPLIDSGGTFAGQPLVYYATANQGFSTSVPLNCNYVKVTVKNTGSATTTTLNLNTAFGNLPSADTQGRVPVSTADCIPVLNTSITAVGTSGVIDTLGFGAIVTQITGSWAGFCTFEVSNVATGTDWDTVLVFTRDGLSLTDIVNQNGTYSVRPSGRYIRINVSQITGTMVVNAIGRDAEGIAASDLLSLAMDPATGTPMQTQARGSMGRPLAQDPFGVASVNNAVRPLQVKPAFKVGDVLFTMPCADMTSISLMFYNPTVTYTVVLEGFFPGGWLGLNIASSSNGGVAGYTLGSGTISCAAGSPSYNTASLSGCTLVRARVTVHAGTNAITASGYLAATAIGPTIPSVNASQTGTWTVSNNPGGVSPGMASTNTTLLGSSAQTVSSFGGAFFAASDHGFAARTTSGNSGTITDLLGGAIGAIIVVSAVSGTTPTLDIVLQESLDGGTTWDDVWHCERLTANGTLRVPSLPLNGRRRWAWTIGGTTPSFTFGIGPTRGGTHPYTLKKQFFDRALDLTTTGATGTVFQAAGCSTATVLWKRSAVVTGVSVGHEFSPDAVNWSAPGSTFGITTVDPTSTYHYHNGNAPFMSNFRLKTTAGVAGNTLTFAAIFMAQG